MAAKRALNGANWRALNVAWPYNNEQQYYSAANATVVRIVGGQHKLALRSDGTLLGWGAYMHGELGPLANIDWQPAQFVVRQPVAIALPGRVVDVAAGNSASFALLEDGRVFAWGDGRIGQMGGGANMTLPRLANSTPAFDYRGIERPTPLAGLTDVAAIGLQLALMKDGTVRQWNVDLKVPTAVPGLADIVGISSSGGHALAVTRDGHVYSWGSNFSGELGRPPRQEAAMPVPALVPGLDRVSAVVAGPGVSTALKTDGTVWVWGWNGNSQFGFGERTGRVPGPDGGFELTPQQIPGLANVTAVSLGADGRHSLALLKDGTVRAWGNNDWGQLCTGRGPGFLSPPAALKLANVRGVFAVGNHSFFVLSDGALVGCGSGRVGEWPFTAHTRLPAAVALP